MGHNPCIGKAVVNTASYTVMAMARLIFFVQYQQKFLIMAKKGFNVTCTIIFLFWKAWILQFLFTPFQLFSICFVLSWVWFSFFSFLPSQSGGSQPSVAHQFSMEQQEPDHSLGTPAALLKGASDRVLKQGVFSQLPSTINTNQQHDLYFCSPVPDGPWLQPSLQVCALWLW